MATVEVEAKSAYTRTVRPWTGPSESGAVADAIDVAGGNVVGVCFPEL